jgi:formylmethanofuran dehydrogenase subunit E
VAWPCSGCCAVGRRDKRLLALVETDGCFADGGSVATGCWLGRRTLRLVDYGRVAATLIDTVTGRAVRLWPDPRARRRALAWAPNAPDRWHAQLAGYQVMPVEDLLRVEWVRLRAPLPQLLGRPGVHVACSMCGEDILNGRELATPAGPICRACAAEAYYAPSEARGERDGVAAPGPRAGDIT